MNAIPIVVLFLDDAHDPGRETLANLQIGAANWLTTAVLRDLLEENPHPSPVLQILKPISASEEEVRQRAARRQAEIEQVPDLPLETRQELSRLLVELVIQRLQHMSREEIDKMFELTPIEETRAGRELIEKGLERSAAHFQAGMLDLLKIRFPEEMAIEEPIFNQYLSKIIDPAELRAPHRQAALADSLDDFQHILE